MVECRQAKPVPFIPATQAQQDYLAILFIDCGFTRQQRNAWLSGETGKDIHYLDDLSKAEAHSMIDKLKEMKKGKQ
jgi:hypothetical protein